MNVGGYRHNYDDLYEYGEKDHNLRFPCKTYENSLTSSLFLLVKSFGEKIQPSRDSVNIARG